MGPQSRTLWQRYLRPESREEAILRVVLSVAVTLIVGWLLPLNLTTVLLASLIPALGLLLSGLERVHNLRVSRGRQ